MARVAVMQPYFLPYAGYVHLTQAVDTFVWLDDVQYVHRRWMNRNRILLGGQAHWLTLPVREAPLQTTILDKRYELGPETLRAPRETLRHAYGRRPGWESVAALVAELEQQPTNSVARVNEALLVRALELLGLSAPAFLRASELDVAAVSAQDRVIALVRAAGGSEYVNLPGGRDLYTASDFAAQGLQLSFLEPTLIPYAQGVDPFVPALSVLDILANDAVHVLGSDGFAVERALP